MARLGTGLRRQAGMAESYNPNLLHNFVAFSSFLYSMPTNPYLVTHKPRSSDTPLESRFAIETAKTHAFISFAFGHKNATSRC